MKPPYGVVSSFVYALEGIKEALVTGHNIRIQVTVGLIAIVLGFVLGIPLEHWIVVIVCIGAVIGGECFNSAIEDAVDLASPDLHPLAKHAKDMAAGAVLVISVASFVVGLLVFVPPILSLLGWR